MRGKKGEFVTEIDDDSIRFGMTLEDDLAHGGESVAVRAESELVTTETQRPEFHLYDGCYFFWAPGEEIPRWFRVANGKLYLVGDSSELPPDRKVVYPTSEEFERFEQ